MYEFLCIILGVLTRKPVRLMCATLTIRTNYFGYIQVLYTFQNIIFPHLGISEVMINSGIYSYNFLKISDNVLSFNMI